MKRSFRTILYLFALSTVPLVTVPAARRVQAEIIARQLVEIDAWEGNGIPPVWRRFAEAIDHHSTTYRFHVYGAWDCIQNLESEDLFYDRRQRTLRYEHYTRVNLIPESTHIVLCEGATDAMLKDFVHNTGPAFYCTFVDYCRKHDCFVTESWK